MTGDNVWLLIAIGFLAVATVLWWRKRSRLRRARHWPTQAATVDSTGTRLEQRGNDQSVHVAEVRYSYAVQGETHAGVLRRSFLLIGRAEKWLSRYPTGRSLLVRHDPDKAGDSVLFEDEQPH